MHTCQRLYAAQHCPSTPRPRGSTLALFLVPQVSWSKQSLAVHGWKMHGSRQPLHYYTLGSQCPIRLTEFDTRIRLREHLSSGLASMKPEKSPICWDENEKRMLPMCDEDMLAALAEEDHWFPLQLRNLEGVVLRQISAPTMPQAPCSRSHSRSNRIELLGIRTISE